jgi:23S rRNA (cytidine1920-2'-O)/16S rRNA (cytidine1409-2'-O)-methyltransferase
LDAELVRRGLANSRAEAVEMVEAGHVLVGGAPAAKPSRLVSVGEALRLTAPPSPYVGRGGFKLEAALDCFGIDPLGKRVLDAGASTGGFTDCVLQRGASSVVALDVGRGQLHERLRMDRRVTVIERTDIRDLDRAGLDQDRFDLVVADLSFISLRTVARDLLGCVSPGGDLVVLIKPQFEAGREEASRSKGVIRDPRIWQRSLFAVSSAFITSGAAIIGLMVSPLRGADGNVAFFAHLRPSPDVPSGLDNQLQIWVERVVSEAEGTQPGVAVTPGEAV